ncbi:hypothetical protein PR048_027654 [Dryococelus australis]|uniref:Uncharacterized protein n=1 Tax=Dryococelus australis TaxID=614101 RepID=A0ABQ9GH33_9NEOP|nr:hypothetical protein PR048_027654 [Dryococelus australis]
MFGDSEIAKSFTLGSTKVAYEICHGLGPYFHLELVKFINKLLLMQGISSWIYMFIIGTHERIKSSIIFYNAMNLVVQQQIF